MSVATQAFVANHTSLADRTRYMSINTAINNSLSCCGPVFNVLIYALPQRTESLEFVGVRNRVYVFNHFTYVGYFVCVAQFLILVAVAVAFTEPPRAPRKVELAWERDAPPRPSAPLGPLGDAMTLWGLVPSAQLDRGFAILDSTLGVFGSGLETECTRLSSVRSSVCWKALRNTCSRVRWNSAIRLNRGLETYDRYEQ